ncbi:MAG: tRNA (adenosine(37)-N6)-dimethylallyltransferase MiaA [Bacteroidetes bacterium]|nr:MAG: tRNA (adenosine(37)-N6)-dimethylallyltransferase MiaA [Bacteroidota bacterium]
MESKTVIIVAGPTAVGKTAISLQLAEQFSTSIISADSRQCFKELNIGVAKPAEIDLQRIHHYFINSHSIHEQVTAADFEQLALGWADEIFRDHNEVIMVGGTGLYIKAFVEGMDEIPFVPAEIREEIQSQYSQKGLSWLQNELSNIDPAYYAGGEILNPQRSMRALEVARATGRSILSFRSTKKKQRSFDILTIGLQLPMDQLKQRIDTRVDGMMADGLEEEVRGLTSFREFNALRTVGYTELFEYFDGKISLNEAVEMIKKNTRQYAKRQLTWFRKNPSLIWVEPDLLRLLIDGKKIKDPGNLRKQIQKIIKS